MKVRAAVRGAGLRAAVGALAIGLGGFASADDGRRDAGDFVRALRMVQQFGSTDAADARHDERTKAALARALAAEGAVTARAVEDDLFDAHTFAKLAGEDMRLDTGEAREALHAQRPRSRGRLLPAVRASCDALTTSFDRIDAMHLAAGDKLADWIVANYHAGKPLRMIFVCTGNSRRSILGATMANVAADYWGLSEIRCASGGTAPTAFHARTAVALREFGLEVEPTGEEVVRSLEGAPNPVFRVRWGELGEPGEAAMETLEFSKHYTDPSNPQRGFAALMVCSQADQECPAVQGASIRIPMPYLDPKLYDGSEYESAKYAERRDDLGRLMLAVMLKARRQLEAVGKIAQTRPTTAKVP